LSAGRSTSTTGCGASGACTLTDRLTKWWHGCSGQIRGHRRGRLAPAHIVGHTGHDLSPNQRLQRAGPIGTSQLQRWLNAMMKVADVDRHPRANRITFAFLEEHPGRRKPAFSFWRPRLATTRRDKKAGSDLAVGGGDRRLRTANMACQILRRGFGRAFFFGKATNGRPCVSRGAAWWLE
jgi:hypothetical protein